jgi:hypothetical protein
MARLFRPRVKGFGRIGLAAGAAVLWPGVAHAVSRFYTGPSGGSWNTAANWNTVEGGGGSTGVPANGDLVFIRGAVSKNVTYDGNYSSPGLSGLTIDSSVGATLTVTQSANALFVTGQEAIGSSGNGVYTQSGGTNTVTSNLILGNLGGSNGTYNLSGSGLLSNAGPATLGFSGAATFVQSGGTHSTSSYVNIAAGAGGTAAYTMTAGTLSFASTSYWGYDGSATFTQSGGTTTGGSVIVGNNTGSGVINISNTANFTLTGSLDLGGDGIPPEGTGVLNMSGGTMSVASVLRVRNTGSAAPGGTRVNLSGGTLNADSLDTSGNPSRFNWTVGTLAITGASGFIVGPTGPLGLTLPIAPGQTLSVTNTLTVNSNSLLTIDGGSVSAGVLDLGNTPSRLNWISGSLAITGAGGLTLSAGSAFGQSLAVNRGCNLSVSNTLTTSSPGVLYVDGGSVYAGSIANGGEINLLDAQSQLSGGTFNNTGLLRGDGRINNILTNGSTGEVRASNADRLVFTAFSNTNNGKINLVNGGTVEFTGPLTNSATGRIAGRGTFICSGTLTNNGLVQMSAGFSDIFGPVTNNNDILITGGGTTTFYDPISNTASGDINVAANSAVVFLGSVLGAGTLSGSGTKYFADGSSMLVALESPGSSVVEAPASVTTSHVREMALDVRGEMTISPNGTAAGVSRVNTLAVSGRLDITNNKIIVTAVSVGSLAGSTYTGISGLIQSGRNGSALPLWDGNGIVTSQTHATGGNYHSIGVSTAAQARGIAATATALWGGQVVWGTDVLVMYTYGGDANLDGKINVDDYIRIDSGIAAGLTGWSNGDFNYDGKVSIDDYITIIDANIGNQNGFVFPTGSGIGEVLSTVAVPEPAGLSVALGGVALLARRRRRL